jgi:aryl-alcohol dehydrogenase-like predicted oxidoreductase
MNYRNIIVGGAQFGFEYGKFRPSSILNSEHINNLLKYASKVGCTTLDIAQNYIGCVERLTTSDLSKDFKIQNKVVYSEEVENSIKKELDETLTSLRKERYQCLSIHNWSRLDQRGKDKALNFLESLKEQKYTEGVGISVYDANEVDFQILNERIDQIQAPLNFFKREFLYDENCALLADKGVAFHARSIFAQGTMISRTKEISERFPELSFFSKFQDRTGLNPLQAALSVFDSQDLFSSLVVGTSTTDELREIVNSPNMFVEKSLFEELAQENLPISNPRDW